MNDIFFEDKRDKTIAHLRRIIEEFKKYDDERKRYIKHLEFEIGQLKSYITELEEATGEEKYVAKCMRQKELIKGLTAKLELLKIPVDEINDALEKVNAVREMRELDRVYKEYRELKKEKEQLFAKYVALKIKYGEVGQGQ